MIFLPIVFCRPGPLIGAAGQWTGQPACWTNQTPGGGRGPGDVRRGRRGAEHGARVQSHWDWEHLALFGVFFMFFRQTGARASNCFRFKDKLHPIFLRFHSFTIHDSVESVRSLEVSSADVSPEFSQSVHCSLPLCGNSSIEVLKFIPL